MKSIEFCVIVLLAFSSCIQSKEDEVSKEFKNYVNSNFDNPKNLEEIVSVEQIDSINFEQFCKVVNNLHKLASLADTCRRIEEDQTSNIIAKIKAHKYASFYSDDVRFWLIYNVKLTDELISCMTNYGDKEKNLSDSIDNLLLRLDGLSILQFKIKVRVKERGILKLKNYYALEDSTGFRFFDSVPTFNDYSERTAVFYKVAKEYEDIIQMRQNILDDLMELNSKTLRILD